jgi:hypothetical protein
MCANATREGVDIRRIFGEWCFGKKQPRTCGPHHMTRTALEGFGKSLLASDQVIIEATANCMGVSRVLAPFVARVIIAGGQQIDDDHRRESGGRRRDRGGDRRHRPVQSPQKLVSYFGPNPRVRQSGLGAAHHRRISTIGRRHARAMLVEAA